MERVMASERMRGSYARLASGALTLTLSATLSACSGTSNSKAPDWAIVIHGGAGSIERDSTTAELETAYRSALSTAVEAGATLLRNGGSALDAVESTVRLMEDDPLFNAGRGAVFSAIGRNELDASIMDGASLAAGAVAAVTRVRHPITLARAVMEKSPHVLLAGEGAEMFAEQQKVELVDPSFFFTERRWRELEQTLKERGDRIPSRPPGVPKPQAAAPPPAADEHAFGTVGVVALDSKGNLAAGTSTGGRTGKQWGRIGDSPIIGAGTYASNQSCAVSGTGVGEFFIRLTIAREVCALVQYQNLTPQQSADEVVQRRLGALEGTGGVIVVSPKGDMAWSFNTPGMYRARVSSQSSVQVSIFKDER
jgi:beta-aspartyl-peptidase (threonine type)